MLCELSFQTNLTSQRAALLAHAMADAAQVFASCHLPSQVVRGLPEPLQVARSLVLDSLKPVGKAHLHHAHVSDDDVALVGVAQRLDRLGRSLQDLLRCLRSQGAQEHDHLLDPDRVVPEPELGVARHQVLSEEIWIHPVVLVVKGVKLPMPGKRWLHHVNLELVNPNFLESKFIGSIEAQVVLAVDEQHGVDTLVPAPELCACSKQQPESPNGHHERPFDTSVFVVPLLYVAVEGDRHFVRPLCNHLPCHRVVRYLRSVHDRQLSQPSLVRSLADGKVVFQIQHALRSTGNNLSRLVHRGEFVYDVQSAGCWHALGCRNVYLPQVAMVTLQVANDSSFNEQKPRRSYDA